MADDCRGACHAAAAEGGLCVSLTDRALFSSFRVEPRSGPISRWAMRRPSRFREHGAKHVSPGARHLLSRAWHRFRDAKADW